MFAIFNPHKENVFLLKEILKKIFLFFLRKKFAEHKISFKFALALRK
jgi:hypothetical protein